MLDLIWKLVLLAFSVFVFLLYRHRQKQTPRNFANRDPSRSALVYLYWKEPLASTQANKVLYWCGMVPLVCMGLGLLFIELDERKAPSWGSYYFVTYSLCALSIVRGPIGFAVSPTGIFWKEVYSWEQVANHHWQSEKLGEFLYLKLPGFGNQATGLTRLGPFTTEDRQRIDELVNTYSETEREPVESAAHS